MITANTIFYNECDLVHFLQQKNKYVFNYLYDNYSGRLFAVIHKIVKDFHTAEDVLQNVFIKIWAKIDQYDPTKGKLFTWMLNIANNASVDALRSKGEIMKKKICQEDALAEMATKAVKHTDNIGIRSLMESLRPECRMVMDMVYFQGYTLLEAAKILDIPLGTAKTRVRTSLKNLKNSFTVMPQYQFC